jgi:competence protein ComEA
MRKTIAALALALILSPAALAQSAPVSGVVNVNAATAEQLQLLPRVGPVLASAIIAARPLADLNALDAVKGVGEKTLELIEPHVTFQGETTLETKISAPKSTKKPVQDQNAN